MFANARRVPAFVHAIHRGLPAASHGVTTIVISVGITGQLDDVCLGLGPASWVDLHSAFGLILCGAMIAKFFRGLQRVAEECEVDDLVRHLSRQVYTLLYFLFAVRLLASATFSLGHAGTADADVRAGLTAAPRVFTPDDFQVYLVYGLLALATVRVLAAVRRQYRS